MSEAPAWVVKVLDDHVMLFDFRDDFLGCACGSKHVHSMHRPHEAQMVWDEVERRANEGTLEITYQLTLEEPKVIPSRSDDPVTSHKAEPPKMRADSQRAKLLVAFDWIEHTMGRGGTDEDAMFYSGVSERSEYSKRCSELREAGFIEPTGETRVGSSGHQRIVSRITDKGREWIRSNT